MFTCIFLPLPLSLATVPLLQPISISVTFWAIPFPLLVRTSYVDGPQDGLGVAPSRPQAAAAEDGGSKADAEPAAHAAAAIGVRDGGGGGSGRRGRRRGGEEGRRDGGLTHGLRLSAVADGHQEEALLDLRVRHL